MHLHPASSSCATWQKHIKWYVCINIDKVLQNVRNITQISSLYSFLSLVKLILWYIQHSCSLQCTGIHELFATAFCCSFCHGNRAVRYSRWIMMSWWWKDFSDRGREGAELPQPNPPHTHTSYVEDVAEPGWKRKELAVFSVLVWDCWAFSHVRNIIQRTKMCSGSNFEMVFYLKSLNIWFTYPVPNPSPNL